MILAVMMAAAGLTGCSRKEQADSGAGAEPAAQANQDVTYAQAIKPIFDKNCIKCHGKDKQKAGLRLDSREAAIQGSDDGPVFEIGKSAESVLVTNISRTGSEDDWMPPVDRGEPLTRDQIALIRAWIDQGAK
jgi:mono/diheme cytochrome c family protein